MNTQRGFALIITVVAILLIGGITIAGWVILNQENSDDSYHDLDVTGISTYETCVAAGYPVAESYPEQCIIPGGQSFTRVLSDEEQNKLDADSQTDNEARNNAERIVNFVNNYAANNSGRYPALEDFPAELEIYDLPNATIVNTTPKSGEIQYWLQAECVDGMISSTNSKRRFAVQVMLSNDNLYCVDNS